MTTTTQITNLTVTVYDRAKGVLVAAGTGLTPTEGDQFVQRVYRAHPGRNLTARIELDLTDECLGW